MVDLDKMIKRYLAAAETMGECIRETQQSVGAANLIGQQILAHPDFKMLPAEMQGKFAASQVSAAAIIKSFEGFTQ